MAELATLDDIAALGAVESDLSEDSDDGERATRLIQLASAEALAYLDGFDVDEEAIEGWPEFRRDALSAVVAEIAAKRLNVAAAPSVDPYTYGSPAGPQTIRLNKAEKRALAELVPIDMDDDESGGWWKP